MMLKQVTHQMFAAGALLVLLAAPGFAHRLDAEPTDREVLADFDKRVKAYASLRDELERGAAELDTTDDPAEILAAERALAARIRAARPDAKRGDIFTPEIAARFRDLLEPKLTGARGRNTRAIIHDEGPGAGGFPFKVNGTYPKSQPRGTVPPNILETLPPLPENLEYRFIHKHLVLRDRRANLIVDYISNAMP